VIRTAYLVTHGAMPFWIIPMAFLVAASLAWGFVLRWQLAITTKELRAANELLQQAALEDALTGVANRRRFDEVLDREIGYSRHASTPLSLVMIDIDHFKDVNDLYGHQQGDKCLVEVVRVLRRAVFPAAATLVARYGGEEFAIVLPSTPEDAATALAEQIRINVVELAIPQPYSPYDQCLTVSLGVATLSSSSPALAEYLIGMADRALYHAKQTGRNRVVAFSKLSHGQSAKSFSTSSLSDPRRAVPFSEFAP
jgi:diguanylate cyclase (GGDEF)-like protein